MNILGINAFCGGASAALVKDGVLVAAVSEERLNRHKHSGGFPTLAVRAVLADSGTAAEDLDHLAVSRDPKANLYKKILFAARKRTAAAGALKDQLAYAGRLRSVSELLAAALGVRPGSLRSKLHWVEHHAAHLASAFFVSPFEEAACLSIGGFGDFVSTMRGLGRDRDLDVLDRVELPHSAGRFYTAITQLLGFHRYGDEWKVMTLAPYGKPHFVTRMREIIHCADGGRFALNQDYFRYPSELGEMTWDDRSPTWEVVFSPKLNELLGPSRDPEDPELFGKWADIAHSAQAVYEEVLGHVLVDLQRRAGVDKLCLTGGCASNSAANGKILERSKFRRLFAQPAADSEGTAIGAAFYVEHVVLKRPRRFVMRDAYTGPAFDDVQITEAIEKARRDGWDSAISVRRLKDADLYREAARATAEGKVVGWFQGRAELGQHALGNRSIIADPRRADLKYVLHRRIGQRETYAPFAASVLEEKVSEIFEPGDPSPFMMVDYKIKEVHRSRLPAVTHLDGTGRLQTVSAAANPRYYALICEFERQTGMPLVLNTSFDEREPLVMTPEHALSCYLSTRMDVLALGNWMLARPSRSDA
jgi:carbamoyltransferase